MASASRRALRSRSRRRVRRWASGSGAAVGVVTRSGRSLREGDAEDAFLVAPVHALQVLEVDVLAVVLGRALDEALGQGAQLARRAVAHDEGLGRGVVEVEDRPLPGRASGLRGG